MTDDRRISKLDALFSKVVNVEPEVRERILEEYSATDAELVADVRALLEADQKSSYVRSVITRAIDAAKSGQRPGPGDELIGRTVGVYQLTGILGRGGSGTVYLGERKGKQYSKRVAIKVVGTAVLNSSLTARVHSEESILSSLDHPYIAKLIDAGEMTEGYPYLVMEFAHGLALDKYCNEHSLSIPERLKLFCRVCEAVQYAHKRLIVHRDLKPSNILVMEDGDPKLLDFGIAKLLASSPSHELTRLNDRALTPDYASPEQIAGQPITTASDIYALGVLLYELLSGLRPYSIENCNQLEVERAICIIDPPKPSTALSRAEERAAENYHVAQLAAAGRKVSVARLRGILVGDLDAIVMRALRKEPDKRYSSVEAMAADIQRYLSSEPVEARHGNRLYYSTRFVRRHALPVTALSLLGIGLIIFSVTSTVLYRNASIDREHADRLSEFMSSIFQESNLYTTQGRQGSTLELLDAARRRGLNDLKNDPVVQMRFLKEMGKAYLSMQEFDKSADLLNQAVALEGQLKPDDRTMRASTLVLLAAAERGLGLFDSAEQHFLEAKQLLGPKALHSTLEGAKLLRGMGRLAHNRSNLTDAEKYYSDSVAITRRLGNQPLELAISLRELSTLYTWMNKLPEAERTGREALTLFEQTTPEGEPDRALGELVLGKVYVQMGRWNEAATLIERVVTVHRPMYNNSGPQLAQTLETLATIRQAQGRNEDAEALLRESLQLVEHALGKDHHRTGYSKTSLGKLLVQMGHYTDAADQLRAALSNYEKSLPPRHQYVAATQYWLGEALIGSRKNREAVTVLESALQIGSAADAPTWLRARTESALGQALAQVGDRRRAAMYLQSSYDQLKRERGDKDEATRTAFRRLTAFQKKTTSH